jgi:hypothetical protein
VAEDTLCAKEFEALVQEGGMVDANWEFNVATMAWAASKVAEETCRAPLEGLVCIRIRLREFVEGDKTEI